MTLDLGPDVIACAGIVERGDPHRFRAAMAAPPEARRVLFPLYAFNVEVARAPWVTQEPGIAAIRLQWWRDALAEIADGGPVRRHEVVLPLALVLDRTGAALLDDLIVARHADLEAQPFADAAALSGYLEATSGGLTLAAARALGLPDGRAAPGAAGGAGDPDAGRDGAAAAGESVVDPGADPAVAEGAAQKAARDAGWALGLANWLLAVPELTTLHRVPLPPGADIAALAGEGLDRLTRARARRGALPGAAMLPVAGAGAILRAARARPDSVAAGGLARSPFRQRLALAFAAATGRW